MTRREQLDRNRWWNRQLGPPVNDGSFKQNEKCAENEDRAPGIAVRRHADSIDKDLVELNFGYEKPNVKRDYRVIPQDMDTCKWDQVDVRMHFSQRRSKINGKKVPMECGTWRTTCIF